MTLEWLTDKDGTPWDDIIPWGKEGYTSYLLCELKDGVFVVLHWTPTRGWFDHARNKFMHENILRWARIPEDNSKRE